MKSTACMPSMLISSTCLMPLPPWPESASAETERPANAISNPAPSAALCHNLGILCSVKVKNAAILGTGDDTLLTIARCSRATLPLSLLLGWRNGTPQGPGLTQSSLLKGAGEGAKFGN